MAAFRFRLAGVLSIWRRREDAAFAILQRESAVFAAARASVWECERRVADARAAGERALHDPATFGDSSWHRNWITHLARQLEQARQHAHRCEARERAARAGWQRARRDRRMIERLRERAVTRHVAAERAVERTQMDELARMRAPKGHEL